MQGQKKLQSNLLSLSLLALMGLAVSASAQVATNWVAFNDHRMPPGPGPTTHSNTTVYSVLGYPAPTGGPLKDHFTAATLSAVLRVISTGGDGPDDFGACQDPNVGTPAYNLFNGIVDVGGPDDNGIVGLRNGEMNVSTITFTNLDPSQRYVFRGTSVRGNNYNDRWAIYEIQGAASFVNAHVDGSANTNLLTETSFPAAGLTVSQVALNSGENRAGSLIGWDEIDPGEDGSFSIVQRQYVGPAPFGNPSAGPYGYGMNAIMLAEVGEPVPVSITRQPEGQTLFECRSFTLSVGVSGSFPRSFQWTKDDIDIPGATTATYSVALAQTSDSGTYRVRVSNPLNTVTSDPAVVTVNEDTAPPIALGASSVHPLEIGIQFNELMESNTTTSTFGYTVNGGPPSGPSVTNVILRPNGTSVILQLDSAVSSPFTVNLTEAYDCAGNIIDPSTSLTGSQWADSGDVGLPALAGNAFSHEVGDVEISAGGNDIWGMADQFHYVHNFRTGDFDVKVKVTSLDPTDPSAKAGLMARETLDGGSATIWAITMSDRPPGRRIYEPGRRATTGGATAAWGSFPPSGLPNAWIRLRRNGDIFRAYHGTNGSDWLPLAGPVTQLLPPGVSVGLATTSHNINQRTLGVFRDFGDFTYPGATLAINPQPASQTVQTHQSVTFTSGAVASGAPASEIFYQWQRSPDGTTWTNIPGANTTSVSLQFPAGDDDGDSFRLVASIPGATATSDAATLTLTPDTVRPTVRAVIGVSATKVVVLFSEPMGPSTPDPFNYQIDQGIAIIDATFDPNNRRRIDLSLDATTPLTAGVTYTLTTTAMDDSMGGFIGATDPSGNPINPNPTTTMFVAQNYPGDPNTLRELPTDTKRPLGSLTVRGFDGRMVQVSATVRPPLMPTVEQMLSGTLIDPSTGMPYPNLAPMPTFVETNTINYGDNPAGPGTGRLLPDRAFPGYTAAADNMAMEVLTWLELRGGVYRMGVNSDDDFRVTPATGVNDPNNSIVLGEFTGGRAPADTAFDFIAPEDGLYPFRLVWIEYQGGATGEWWIQSLVNSSYIAINSDSIKAFRNVIVAPRLTATRGDGTITLSWTDPEGAFQLQSSLYLEEPAWSNVSGVMANGNDRSITINTSNYPTEFFRLRKP